MARVLSAVVAALALLGCTTPYQPAQAELPELQPNAFEVILDVTRSFYPELEIVDREAFRIQSRWLPHQSGDRPGEKRVSLFVENEQTLNVVVETRYLGLDLFGSPVWSETVGDPMLERNLLRALIEALAPEESDDTTGP